MHHIIFQYAACEMDILVELHEDDVPNFQYIWVVHVDLRRGIPPTSYPVKVDLSARTAWTNVSCESKLVLSQLHFRGKTRELKIF